LALPTSPFVQNRMKHASEIPRSDGRGGRLSSALAYPSSNLGTPRSHHRRGDVLGSRAVDNLLQSQGSELGIQSSVGNALTSDPTAVKKVIWGTNVDVLESMTMFKDFIAHFTQAQRKKYTRECLGESNEEEEAEMETITDKDELPFYDYYLSEVCFIYYTNIYTNIFTNIFTQPW
jgi:DNA replication licensing factor MCM4